MDISIIAKKLNLPVTALQKVKFMRFQNREKISLKWITLKLAAIYSKSFLKVVSSPFSKTLPKALIDFMEFVRQTLKEIEF